MEYPLKVSFKVFTFATQIPVTDVGPVCYVRQAPLKLKNRCRSFQTRTRPGFCAK